MFTSLKQKNKKWKKKEEKAKHFLHEKLMLKFEPTTFFQEALCLQFLYKFA